MQTVSAMTTPTTAAEAWVALLDCGDNDHGDSVAEEIVHHRPLIQAAIEAEAVAAYKARLVTMFSEREGREEWHSTRYVLAAIEETE
jgi:hypothetical protein